MTAATPEQIAASVSMQVPLLAAERLPARAWNERDLALYVAAHNATCQLIGCSPDYQVDLLAKRVLQSETLDERDRRKLEDFVLQHLERLQSRQEHRRARIRRNILPPENCAELINE